MKRIIVCLCLCLASVSSEYGYDCHEDGTISIFGLSAGSFIYLNNIVPSPTPTPSQIQEVKSCLWISAKEGIAQIPNYCVAAINNVERTVEFLVYDPSIDIKLTPQSNSTLQTPTTPHKGSPFWGKDHRSFQLTCKQLSTKGVIKHIIGPLVIKDTATLAPNYNSLGNIEMRFKAEEKKTATDILLLPDISTVYIGDKFYMYLKYMGVQDYLIAPQTCTAFGDLSSIAVATSTEHVDLIQDGCITNSAKDFKIMNNFNRPTDEPKKIVYAELFGFHFTTGGSITLSCDVKVCHNENDDITCKIKNNGNCITNDWNRKRRSSTNDETFKVTQTIKVLNRRVESNSTGLVKSDWCRVTLVVMFVLLLKNEYH